MIVNNPILDTILLLICVAVIWFFLGLVNMFILCPIYFKYHNKIHKHMEKEEMNNDMIGYCFASGPLFVLMLLINEYHTWTINHPNIDVALLCRKCATKINSFWKLP